MYSSRSSVPVEATFGPTHVKFGARMDGSRSPRSEATITLARVKRDSGSLEMGGGTDGGRGWTDGCCDWSLSENGLGRFSRKDAIRSIVGTRFFMDGDDGNDGDDAREESEVEEIVEDGTEGTKAVEPPTVKATTARTNFMLFVIYNSNNKCL